MAFYTKFCILAVVKPIEFQGAPSRICERFQTAPRSGEGASPMTKKRFSSVWDAIEDTPPQAENMKLRSALIMALKDHITRAELSQSEAAKLLGVTQPRVSDLMRGKIELFGLDTLVNMITAAGLRVEMRISNAA
jgi:predicted XRE-type DNA-binding protein